MLSCSFCEDGLELESHLHYRAFQPNHGGARHGGLMRPPQNITQFPALDHEPRGHGPPPSYRTSAATEDSWSTFSGSNQAMNKQRRSSWSNLVDVGDPTNNAKNPQAQKQPPPRPNPPPTNYSGSRTSSEMGIVSDIFTTYTGHRTPISEAITFIGHSKTGQPAPQRVYAVDPRLVSIPRPAGTLPSHSVAGSRAPSIIAAPIVSPGSKTVKTSVSIASTEKKRNRLQDILKWIKRPRNVLCCMCLLLLIIIAVVIAIVLSQVLPLPKNATFNWSPPNGIGNGQNVTSNIQMSTQQNNRIRFALQGSAPFKGNFINYYDFNTNQAIVVDQGLQANGRNLYCFVVPMDHQSMPNEQDVRRAAVNSVPRSKMMDGWMENWNWIPSPLQAGSSFNPPIPECQGARIVQLQPTGDQRNRRCTDCYDFCLPDYGVMRDQRKNENYLNIVRRNCFYLFVPEWRTYAQASTIEQNQQDFDNYYRTRQHMQVNYGAGTGPNESRWISLGTVPKTIGNATGNFVGAIGQAATDFRQQVFGGGSNQPQPQSGIIPPSVSQGYPGQQNYGPNSNTNSAFGPNSPGYNPNQPNNGYGGPNGFGNAVVQGQGYHPTVSGVVNLNGVNGNSGSNEYNRNSAFTANNGEGYGSNYPTGSNPNNLNSNLNSGYTGPNTQISSGNSGPNPTQMNGFGAQPSYMTSQYGFNENGQPIPRSISALGYGGSSSAASSNPGYGSANVNYSPGSQSIPPTGGVVAGSSGATLNEYGNPVSSSANAATPATALSSIRPTRWAARRPPPAIPNYRPDMAGQARAGSLGLANPTGYQPNVTPVDYNIPSYNQIRQDTIGRPRSVRVVKDH
ncbi:unnamed protein product [Caenorhabditis auriculariae]|uniref:Uncharacterized protein n=1 Tax=Caenorhabditis auriculariae TaxID=2777116 RepID=A0A8S1HRV4_9PELO|nr:unnamed protein product [Caenorhabditis auriculariae]